MNAMIHPPLHTPNERAVQFRADIAKLSGTLFSPGTRPEAAIVLHGATGVAQSFYADFARWLAGQGFACLTYDYRDFGRSRSDPVAASTATMVDWGLRDQQAAQAFLESEFPGRPVWVIGHSLGGLMLPFQTGAARVARLIAVASGPVHISDHPAMMKAGAAMLWYGPGPLATRFMGRTPGCFLAMKRDLPKGVFWQWRRWCTSRGFYLGDVGRTLPVPDLGAFHGTARFVAVADDAMVPPEVVWRLMQFYPEARKKQAVIRPDELGLGKIGHIALFHRKNAKAWPMVMGQVG